MRTYYEVSTSFVKDELPLGKVKLETARRATAAFLQEMKMPWIAVRWFVPEDELPHDGPEVIATFTQPAAGEDENLLGLFRPGQWRSIFLNASADVETIAETAVHELMHCYWYLFETTNNLRTPEVEEHVADRISALFCKKERWRENDAAYIAYLTGAGFDQERQKGMAAARAKWAAFRTNPAKPTRAMRPARAATPAKPVKQSNTDVLDRIAAHHDFRKPVDKLTPLEFEVRMKWLGECGWREARAKQKLREVYRLETGNFSL